jgi:hypothetical protein
MKTQASLPETQSPFAASDRWAGIRCRRRRPLSLEEPCPRAQGVSAAASRLPHRMAAVNRRWLSLSLSSEPPPLPPPSSSPRKPLPARVGCVKCPRISMEKTRVAASET